MGRNHWQWNSLGPTVLRRNSKWWEVPADVEYFYHSRYSNCVWQSLWTSLVHASFCYESNRARLPTEWPTRSPDLTLVTTSCGATSRPTSSTQRHHLLKLCVSESSKNLILWRIEDPGMVRRAVAAMQHRANTCAQCNGGHVKCN